MAQFNTTGFDDIEKMLLRQSDTATKAIPKMLEAGAKVLAEAQKKELKAMNIEDSGELIRSIKASKVTSSSISSTITVSPTGKDKKGVRNAEKGFIAEYGKHGQPKRAWQETANIKSEAEVHAAMRKVWEEMNNGG